MRRSAVHHNLPTFSADAGSITAGQAMEHIDPTAAARAARRLLLWPRQANVWPSVIHIHSDRKKSPQRFFEGSGPPSQHRRGAHRIFGESALFRNIYIYAAARAFQLADIMDWYGAPLEASPELELARWNLNPVGEVSRRSHHQVF